MFVWQICSDLVSARSQNSQSRLISRFDAILKTCDGCVTDLFFSEPAAAAATSVSHSAALVLTHSQVCRHIHRGTVNLCQSADISSALGGTEKLGHAATRFQSLGPKSGWDAESRVSIFYFFERLFAKKVSKDTRRKRPIISDACCLDAAAAVYDINHSDRQHSQLSSKARDQRQ